MTDMRTREEDSAEFYPEPGTAHPERWLKSVCAFANSGGGRLVFGMNADGAASGIPDAQQAAERVRKSVRENIFPCPGILPAPEKADGKNILVLTVFPNRAAPCYIRSDNGMEAYIRSGRKSVPAEGDALDRLTIRHARQSYDALASPYDFRNFSFAALHRRFKAGTGRLLGEKRLHELGLQNDAGKLTNAGALLADNSPIRHSRLRCTRWIGPSRGGGPAGPAETVVYSGGVFLLLDEGYRFIWNHAGPSRSGFVSAAPGYCESSCHEALVNALLHRNYLMSDAEIRIDIFDDRLKIRSPGGMPDGPAVQHRDLTDIPAVRRNPVLTGVFEQLGYIEHPGNGLRTIYADTVRAANFRRGKEPVFHSDRTSFTVTLPNLNY